jgi:hypothetical protein
MISLTAFKSAQFDEYLVKSFFIEKFTRFIEWSDNSDINNKSLPFKISVIGEDPFKGKLEEYYSDKKIKNKNVEVEYYTTLSEDISCDLLFITELDDNEIEDIVKLARNKSILTVSDTKGYAKKGVIINFFIEGSKIRFEINEKAAKDSNLSISYLLLNTARIIE